MRSIYTVILTNMFLQILPSLGKRYHLIFRQIIFKKKNSGGEALTFHSPSHFSLLGILKNKFS